MRKKAWKEEAGLGASQAWAPKFKEPGLTERRAPFIGEGEFQGKE